MGRPWNQAMYHVLIINFFVLAIREFFSFASRRPVKLLHFLGTKLCA